MRRILALLSYIDSYILQPKFLLNTYITVENCSSLVPTQRTALVATQPPVTN
jgi:hypothetical protein